MGEDEKVVVEPVVLDGDVVERALNGYAAARAARVKVYSEVQQLRSALARAQEEYVKAAVAVDGAWATLTQAHGDDSPPRVDGKPVAP